MDISQKLLGYMLLAALAVGAALGVWYDAWRLSRMLIGLDPPACKTGKGKSVRYRTIPAYLLQFVEDIVFGLSCGLALTLLLYYTNDGRFRAMAVLGMATGYGVYRLTLGRLFDRLAPCLVSVWHWLWKKTAWLLLSPLRGLCHLWRCTAGAAIHRARERRRERICQRDTERARQAYVEAASGGFGLWTKDEKNS